MSAEVHQYIFAKSTQEACERALQETDFVVGKVYLVEPVAAQQDPSSPKYYATMISLRNSTNQESVDYEQKYHNLMDAIKRSRLEHGDCKSGERYKGKPLACTACMANLKLEEAIKEYKGRVITLA